MARQFVDSGVTCGVGDTSSSSTRDWRQPAVIFAIVAVVMLVFHRAAGGSFLLWDDDINILNNSRLRSLGADNLRWMFADSDYMRRYVPLTWLGWAIEHALFGLTPLSAHVGNIALHGINAALVFLLLSHVLALWTDRAPAHEPTLRVAAAFGALVWAVHPLRVEVVAWASGRIYCQAAFFLLVSALCYLRAAAPQPSRPRGVWFGASVVSFVASLLTYPLALGFVAVLVLLDGWVLRRFVRTKAGWNTKGNRAVLLEKVPFLVATLVVVTVTIWARVHAKGIWDPLLTIAQFSLAARAMQAFYIIAYYIWRPVVPIGLSPVYTTLADFQPADAIFVCSVIGIIAISVVAVWKRRRWPALLALWLGHLILIAPMTGLTEHPHYSNDRYSYLQGIVWAMAVAGGVMWLQGTAVARWLRLAMVTTVAAWAMLSAEQIGIWRNSETLFRYLYEFLPSVPNRAEMSFRLGEYLRTVRRSDDAAEAYRQSLRLQPRGLRASPAHLGLGRIADVRERASEAFDHFRQSMELTPNSAETNATMGEFLLRKNQVKDACELLRRAAMLEPARHHIHYLLGVALVRVGSPQNAIAAFETAIRLQPGFADAHGELAAVFFAVGRLADSIVHAREAVRRRPDYAEAYTHLGTALRMLGQPSEAITALREAVRLNPNIVPAHFNLGLALRDMGRTSEAADALRRVLQLEPDDVATREELARLATQ